MTEPRTGLSAAAPRTKAGRDLLDREALNSRSFTLISAESIVAIEEEASLLAAARATTEPGLDAAWQEAEAALPEGWRFGSLRAAVGFDGYVTSVVGWTATAHEATGIGRSEPIEGFATTPAAALCALAAKLMEGTDE